MSDAAVKAGTETSQPSREVGVNSYTKDQVDAKIETSDKSSQAAIEAIRLRIEQTNGLMSLSQKQTDWWLQSVGIILAALAILVAVCGFLIPWWLTRTAARDYEQKIAGAEQATTMARRAAEQATEHAKSAGKSAQEAQEFLSGYSSKGTAITNPNSVDIDQWDRVIGDNRYSGEDRLKASVFREQALQHWESAIKYARQIVEEFPNVAKAYNGLGYYIHKLSQQRANPERETLLKEALIWYRKELGREPSSAVVLNNIGWALTDLAIDIIDPKEKMTVFDEAQLVFNRGLNIAPEMVVAWNNLGWLLINKAQLALDTELKSKLLNEAEAKLKTALKIDPSFAQAEGNLKVINAIRVAMG